MQAPLPACCRHVVFLAGFLTVIIPAGAVHAEALVTGLVGDVRPGAAIPSSDSNSPIAFRSGRQGDQDELTNEAEDNDPAQVLQLLAALLAVPAGCTPTYMNNNPSPASATSTPKKTTTLSSTNPTGDGPGGDSNPPGDLAPEPGSLVSALIGAGLAGLNALRRRRRLRMPC